MMWRLKRPVWVSYTMWLGGVDFGRKMIVLTEKRPSQDGLFSVKILEDKRL